MLSFAICDLINSKKPLRFISERKTKRNGACIPTTQRLPSKCLQDCGVWGEEEADQDGTALRRPCLFSTCGSQVLKSYSGTRKPIHVFPFALLHGSRTQSSTLIASTLAEMVASRNRAFPLTIILLKQWCLRNWDCPGNLMLREGKRGSLVPARQGSHFPGKELNTLICQVNFAETGTGLLRYA